MPQNRKTYALLSALAVTALSATHISVAVAQEQSPFSVYDEAGTTIVDTQPYNEIIQALSVSERGRTLIAYDFARAEALPFFERYERYLANVSVETLNRDEQLAYWLNTRNVLLIQAIAEEQRISGFKRKRGTPDAPGAFWTEPRITVSGVSLSLQDIEQNILFAGWDDANIMFGLYQGIDGGPALPRRAFTGANVTAQLAEAGRQFASLSRNLRVRGDKVRFTTYFDWYSQLAYGGDEALMREHLSTFVQPDLQTVVSTDGTLSRRNLSTSFEQYRTRQASAGSGASNSSRFPETRPTSRGRGS